MFKNFTEMEKKRFCKLDLPVLNFPKDYTIIKEGEEHSALYLIIEGSVRVSKLNQKFSIAELGPGEIFGEMAFISKQPRYSSVIAGERILLIGMDEDFWQEITPEMNIKIKDFLMKLLISRLDRMNEAVVNLAKYTLRRTMSEKPQTIAKTG